MSANNYFVYTGGIGDNIEARGRLAEELSPYGIEVIYEPVVWEESNYTQRRTEVGLMIVELAKKGRVSVGGDSVGGQFELGVFADHPDEIQAAITYSTKRSRFDLPKRAFQYRPNFGLASGAVEADVKKICSKPEMLEKVFCVTSRGDEQIDDLSQLVLEGADSHTAQAWLHQEAIICALTADVYITVNRLLQSAPSSLYLEQPRE